MLDVRRSGFPRHLAAYVSGIVLLAGINLLTSPGTWWVQWPALGSGIGLLSHGLTSMARGRFGDDDAGRAPALSLPDDEHTDDEGTGGLPSAPSRTESDAMVERAEALLRRETTGR